MISLLARPNSRRFHRAAAADPPTSRNQNHPLSLSWRQSSRHCNRQRRRRPSHHITSHHTTATPPTKNVLCSRISSIIFYAQLERARENVSDTAVCAQHLTLTFLTAERTKKGAAQVSRIAEKEGLVCACVREDFDVMDGTNKQALPARHALHDDDDAKQLSRWIMDKPLITTWQWWQCITRPRWLPPMPCRQRRFPRPVVQSPANLQPCLHFSAGGALFHADNIG